MSERKLVERAKRGDGRAYETQVRQYQELAFRTAFLITNDAGDADDAEDATQSAFLKAYLHPSRFRTNAPFRPWILQIVANEAKNARRSHQRHLLRRSDGASAADLATTDSSPELRLIAREWSAWLVEHINALSEDDRLVIYSRYALDLTEAEMAGVLGCARGTVKSRLHRAIGRLRARLGPERPDIDDRMVEERP